MIYGMELNAKKTETMVVTKKQETNIPTCKLTVNGLSLRQIEKFKYLGTMINLDARDESDLNIRSDQAKASFQQMKTVLCNKNISFKTRYRVLKCYIYPIFHCNCESWNILKRMASKINSFEMWCFRRKQRISWMARKISEDVLHQVNQNKSLLKNIKIRQYKFLGHINRKLKLEHLSLTGKINKK